MGLTVQETFFQNSECFRFSPLGVRFFSEMSGRRHILNKVVDDPRKNDTSPGKEI